MQDSETPLSTGESARTLFKPRSQSERVLQWVQTAMVLGAAVLAVFALTADVGTSGWRVFTVGILSALAATAVGGAFGFLFGLPVSSRVTVVNQAAPRSPQQAPGPAADVPSQQRSDWFSDNTSMEQIADWLTKIIVGLTLVQWGSLQLQFNRLAAAVTGAMLAPAADAPAAAARSAAMLLRGDAGRVPGGVILGAYAIFGFILVYLWSRRYLSAELAAGRGDSIRNQREAESAFVQKAAESGAVQERLSLPGARAAAFAALDGDGGAVEVPRRDFSELVERGEVEDDPWKGQFGGHASDGSVEVRANVEELQTQRGWFAVELIVRGATTQDRKALRSSRARIYLHPTFSNAIRVNKFGASGRIAVPLVCYEGFTVGVQLEDGRLFELDLTELPNVPEDFRG
jgi:hypothetical protein